MANENEIAVAAQENQIENVPQQIQPQNLLTMWNDTELFNKTFKMAKFLADSTLVPQAYKGNVGNCVIAIDLANRSGMSPMVVMQNTQVVQGNLTWKGSACKAMIDGCGRYEQSEYVEFGERGKPTWGYYLQAIEKKTGKLVKGTAVTWDMVVGEGWLSKSGSKWKTMPEQMFKYRAATFFARTQCPEVLMGFMTADEVVDVKGDDTEQKQVISLSMNKGGEND